jgi:hypothetical protein
MSKIEETKNRSNCLSKYYSSPNADFP